jgi:DNA-binding NarL/FixJ family response regulator
MKRSRITLFLVDDHEVVRHGLKSLLGLEEDLRILGEAGSVAAAVSKLAKLRPHVILLDMKLPDSSGLDACRHILAAAPMSRVLVMSSFADNALVVEALQCGVHGYVLKDVRTDDLLRAIRTVASGQGYLDPRVAHQTLHWIRHQNHPAPDGVLNRRDRLSPQERAILPLLAEGKTNKEIAVSLRLSDKTVKNYLANIFDKLQVRRRTEAVTWYIKIGQAQLTDSPP